MWLINTKTYKLKQFNGSRIPPYAILSHTWVEDEEVSFEEWRSGRSATSKPGYVKIANTCRLAAKHHNLEWAWVDTCCINSDSTRELDEAIRSMYHWYERAAICFAHLADLHPSRRDLLAAELPRCRWFRRGWTLQELLAPATVRFYDASWTCVGTKTELVDVLVRASGIPAAVLTREMPLRDIGRDEKFSWAKRRTTTRVEDAAYCLLGIFDVDMTPRYGEEGRAMKRLKKKIRKKEEESEREEDSQPAQVEYEEGYRRGEAATSWDPNEPAQQYPYGRGQEYGYDDESYPNARSEMSRRSDAVYEPQVSRNEAYGTNYPQQPGQNISTVNFFYPEPRHGYNYAQPYQPPQPSNTGFIQLARRQSEPRPSDDLIYSARPMNQPYDSSQYYQPSSAGQASYPNPGQDPRLSYGQEAAQYNQEPEQTQYRSERTYSQLPVRPRRQGDRRPNERNPNPRW
ncbi:Vegetative incompatibility protein HET-E-1 [Colletotrichum trifolii]|uniref:Vegetative incompatibility protein HET-E-1 n=1 Tax=Colletotrichum trifolii TaxID=5466 RepID=A0A4V3HXL1_COLTR|nr:Vegetative incompatibility protein HET-E-1 [Colletotrichum trifolii]